VPAQGANTRSPRAECGRFTIPLRHGALLFHRVIPAAAGIHAQGQKQAEKHVDKADMGSGLAPE
jgi:hypothetical protein